MTTTEIYCCETPVIPKGIVFGYGLFGDYCARCEDCGYVCAYWDCGCELAHECKGAN